MASTRLSLKSTSGSTMSTFALMTSSSARSEYSTLSGFDGTYTDVRNAKNEKQEKSVYMTVEDDRPLHPESLDSHLCTR